MGSRRVVAAVAVALGPGTGRTPPYPVPRRLGSGVVMLTTSIIAGMIGRFGTARQMRSIDPIMRHTPEKDPAPSD
jgi:hypothetical protein